MMDEKTQIQYDEKVKQLLSTAKKKTVLEYKEIVDFFKELPLEDEQFDKIVDTLEQNNVIVMRTLEEVDIDDEDIVLTGEDEVDLASIDLSVPEGVDLEDPVRMY